MNWEVRIDIYTTMCKAAGGKPLISTGNSTQYPVMT